MNTKHLIFIDHFGARPLVFSLNYLVRLLGKILSIDHRLDSNFSCIVVCKFKGLGSIIQATPMLQAIRDKHPEAEILFLSTKANASFLSKIDCIDTVIAVDDSSSLRLIRTLTKAVFTLLRKKPGIYIDLEIYSNFSTLLTISTLSKNRIGFYLRSSSFRMGIYTHMMYYNTNVPISEVYMQIARLMDENAQTRGLFPIYKNCEGPLYEGLSEYIVINPNASDLRIERRWGSDNFTSLVDSLCKRYQKKKVVLIGSISEQDYVGEISKHLDHSNLLNLAGKTSVDELILIIRSAELVITNDTGPMHIAFACKTPVVALFGPCSPEQYGWTSNAQIVHKQVYCSPCVHEFVTPPCKGNNTCMQLISVAEVSQLAFSFFKNGKSFTDDATKSSTIHYQNNELVLGLVNRHMIKKNRN